MIKTKPKFEVGQQVSNGTVCAVYSGNFYAMTNPNYSYNNWDKEDPKWIEKFVYVIKLKDPSKNVTLEQFQDGNPELDYAVLLEKYNGLPLWYYMVFPESVIEE